MDGEMMNREIKFRGKRTDSGEWVYGHYFHQSVFDEHIIWGKRENWKVDPATVGQYTGFKDRNDKEIYETDQVKFKNYTREYTGVVHFQKGCFIVKWDSVVGAYGEKATHSVYLKECEDIEVLSHLLDGESE